MEDLLLAVDRQLDVAVHQPGRDSLGLVAFDAEVLSPVGNKLAPEPDGEHLLFPGLEAKGLTGVAARDLLLDEVDRDSGVEDFDGDGAGGRLEDDRCEIEHSAGNGQAGRVVREVRRLPDFPGGVEEVFLLAAFLDDAFGPVAFEVFGQRFHALVTGLELEEALDEPVQLLISAGSKDAFEVFEQLVDFVRLFLRAGEERGQPGIARADRDKAQDVDGFGVVVLGDKLAAELAVGGELLLPVFDLTANLGSLLAGPLGLLASEFDAVGFENLEGRDELAPGEEFLDLFLDGGR